MHLQNDFFSSNYDPSTSFPKEDWDEVKQVFKDEDKLRADFIKTLIQATESILDGKVILYLCDELVEGESDYTTTKAWAEFKMDILKELEGGGFIKIKRLVKKFTSRGHEREVYQIFELTEKDVHKKLAQLLQLAQKALEKKKADAKKKRDIKYRITYAGRKIILNGKYHIGSTRIESPNDRLFEYAFRNSGSEVTRAELKNNGKVVLPKTKQFKNVAYEIGFTDELKKTFFTTTKNSFVFYNHVTSHDLKERGIDVKKLEAQIKGLEESSKKQ